MKQPFTDFSGIAAALPVENINTDAIIPSPWLRTAGGNLAKGLFGALRFDGNGNELDFILNREPFRKAQILFAGRNFGCGSSREAAAWALRDFGIRAVFAPSFADIFHENAFRNGILAARIEEDCLAAVNALIQRGTPSPAFAIDLDRETITGPDGTVWAFAVAASRKRALQTGADEIAMTLEHAAEIGRFHDVSRTNQPWLYRAVEAQGEVQ